MFVKWRLKIRKFIKQNQKIILIVLIAWAIIIAINFMLGHRQEKEVLNTTYTPHNVVLTSTTKVPEKLEQPIEDLIDDYVNKCNNKDFSGAFDLLSEECKTHVFEDSKDKFTEYASEIFKKKKRYSIQNYSNYGDYYIYNIKIIDDIITTGLTNQQYAYYEEKIAIKQNEKDLKLNVDNYMGYTDLKKLSEDDNLKIRVESRENFYSNEIYSIKITNKTEKKVVLYDGLIGDEIKLASGTDERLPSIVEESLILEPGETKTFRINFAKYYDESTKSSQIVFNKIRIMNDYTGNEQSEDEEVSKAEKVYSVSIPLE